MQWFNRWQRKRNSSTNKTDRRISPRLGVERLEEREVPTVLYYGGNVLPHVEAQALFLGDKWSSDSSAAAKVATLNNFLGDVTGGPYMDALTQAGYGVGRGSASPGAVDNVTIPSNSTISDASIQREIQADIKNGLLQAPDANRLYVVYVAPNVAVNLGAGQGTTQQGVLGYHGAFAGQDASGNGTVIRYAVVAYPGGTVRNSSMGTTAIDQLTAVTSHELAEAVTDPDVNYSRLGWYDPRRGEIGDISENNPNALVRLDGFLVQEAVDMNDRLLQIPTNSSPATPTPAPVTTPSDTVATTTQIIASPVRYPWHRFGYPTATLTVKIAPASGSVAPGGIVNLLYNQSIIGAAYVHVVNGVATATFNVRFFGRGSFDFSAQYVGTTQFQPSVSNVVTVTV
jgi:Bacterial Ig-like domain (group 3)